LGSSIFLCFVSNQLNIFHPNGNGSFFSNENSFHCFEFFEMISTSFLLSQPTFIILLIVKKIPIEIVIYRTFPPHSSNLLCVLLCSFSSKMATFHAKVKQNSLFLLTNLDFTCHKKNTCVQCSISIQELCMSLRTMHIMQTTMLLDLFIRFNHWWSWFGMEGEC
jgi:hypothetical protein